MATDSCWKVRFFTFSKGCLTVKIWSGVMVRIRVKFTLGSGAEGSIVSLNVLTSMEHVLAHIM